LANLLPAVGDARVVHAVQRVAQVLAHDDGAVDGQLEVGERGAHQRDHPLDAVHLLPQEDVHWLEGPHLLETLPHLIGRDVVGIRRMGKLPQ